MFGGLPRDAQLSTNTKGTFQLISIHKNVGVFAPEGGLTTIGLKLTVGFKSNSNTLRGSHGKHNYQSKKSFPVFRPNCAKPISKISFFRHMAHHPQFRSKTMPNFRPKCQNLFPISDQNGSKTIQVKEYHATVAIN